MDPKEQIEELRIELAAMRAIQVGLVAEHGAELEQRIAYVERFKKWTKRYLADHPPTDRERILRVAEAILESAKSIPGQH